MYFFSSLSDIVGLRGTTPIMLNLVVVQVNLLVNLLVNMKKDLIESLSIRYILFTLSFTLKSKFLFLIIPDCMTVGTMFVKRKYVGFRRI